MLKKCQEEFYSPKETKITFPFSMDEDERLARLSDIKLGNIRLIGNIIQFIITILTIYPYN